MTTLDRFGRDCFVTTTNPLRTRALHDVDGASEVPVDVIRSAERVVIGGGGLFYEGSARHYAWFIREVLDAGKEVEVFNVGVGNLGADAFDTADALKRCASVTVRDPFSAEFLVEMHVEHTMEWWPDAALTGGQAPFWLGHLPRPLVGVCLKPGAAPLEIEHMPVGTLLPLAESNHPDAREDDVRGSPWGHALSFADPRDLKATISGLDILYTNRKHAAVWALTSGVEVRAVPTDMRGTGIEGAVERLIGDAMVVA